MYKSISLFIILLTTCDLLATPLGNMKEYNLILQTDDNFYSATFRVSKNDTSPELYSVSNFSQPITNTKITALATCGFFLYYAADGYIGRLAIGKSNHFRINKSSSYNNIAIDPYCRSLFLTTSSSLQVSASNTSSTFLTPRVLSGDLPGNDSITSLSYDYINYKLIYSTTSDEIYQLNFNSTSPNRVLKSEKRRIINSAVSHTHLYTLEQNATHTTLWSYDLTRLQHPPTRLSVWNNNEAFIQFTVTADGEWLFYIDPTTNQLAAISISNNSTDSEQPMLFQSLTGLRALRLIPNTQQQLYTDPCLSSSCSHLCLPLSNSESTCVCSNGQQQLTQSPTCGTDLYGASLVAANDGIHVIQPGNMLGFSLLPLTGYSPDTLIELTASGHWIYWSQDFTRNNIPYSHIRATSVATGHTKLVIHELLGRVSGLVVDEISDSLYWSDELLRRIEVSRTSGEYRRVLFDNDVILGAPSNLVADLESLRLYWAEEMDGVYRILSAPIDASSDPELLIEGNIGVVTSLAIDQLNRVLYWSGIDGVKGIDLVTKAMILSGTLLQDNSIAIISVMDGSILNLRSENLSSVFADDSLLIEYTDRIRSITYVPNDRYRTSPCRYGSGHLACPHLCLPSSTGQHSCVCATGFKLNTLNGVTRCEEIGETLYLSQPGLINVYGKDSLSHFRSQPSLDTRIRSGINSTASAISGDVRTGYVYWSNAHEGVIGRVRKDGSGKQVVLEGYHSVEGLAFDPLSGNLFWSDNTAGLIGITTPDGSLQKVLIHARDNIPYSLATDSRSGEVYFSTSSSPHNIITMHGNTGQLRTVVEVRGLAVAIGLGANSNEIYWARNASSENQGQSTVLKCTLPECTDGSFFFDFSSSILHQFAVGSDRLYSVASLVSNPGIFFLQKHYLHFGIFENVISILMAPPGALHLSHLSSQPKQHYCAINNGGCSHFCLLARPSSFGVQEYACECPAHMKLASDQKTCEHLDTFIFVLTEFYILALSKYPHVKDEVVPIGTLYNSRLISFDPIDNTVYWVEASANYSVIKSFGLNKGEMSPKTVATINTVDSQLFNFQIDWVGKYAIWTRTDGNSIEFTRLDNSLSGHLLLNATFHPRALAVDSTASKLFFSDSSDTPSIYSMDIDGNNLEVLVSSQYVSSPSSLVYSYRHKALFWYDYDKHTIAQYNFTTEQVSVIQTLSKAPTLVSLGSSEMKIAVSGEELIWWEKYTDPVSTRFYYYNLLTGGTSATDVSSVGNIYDMVGHTIELDIHHRMHQCLSSDCKGICMNRISSPTCTCPLYTRYIAESMACEPYPCPYVETSCKLGGECEEVSWRCDGVRDCIDGSDEQNCTLECSTNQFQCEADKLCLPLTKQCDGTADCSDGSDETINCIALTNPTILPTSPTNMIFTTLSTDTDQLLLIYIILALVVVIILLICVFPLLIVVSLYLMRPHYRSSTYKIPISNGDVENTGGTPSYETEIRSCESNLPMLKHNMGHIRIPFTPTSSNLGNCSLDLYADFQQTHFFPSLLPPEQRYGSASFDMKTEDLVSDVTDASLERKSFNYENICELRVPPPSVITNNSEVLLSVSQQDIPRAIETSTSGLSHLTTSRSQPFIEYAHPNSEISTALSTSDFYPERPPPLRPPSHISSHYTINTTNRSYTNQQGILHY